MSKKFGFFNSINGDRKYLASDLSQAFDIGITTGLKQEEGNLQVVPYQGMQVQIQPGSAMIHGHFFVNDEPEIITLDVADAELNRIDRIVLRYDAYARDINTAVIKGTPAVNPNPPARLETPEQFDLVLADIYIPAAATEINQSNITDMRDSELCGYIGVKGAVSQIELNRLLAEYAKWVRIDSLSAPVLFDKSATIDNPILIPLQEQITTSNIYAIEFRIQTADERASQLAILAGPETSMSGIVLGVDHVGNIYTAVRSVDSLDKTKLKFHNLRGYPNNVYDCYIYRVFKLKEGVSS